MLDACSRRRVIEREEETRLPDRKQKSNGKNNIPGRPIFVTQEKEGDVLPRRGDAVVVASVFETSVHHGAFREEMFPGIKTFSLRNFGIASVPTEVAGGVAPT